MAEATKQHATGRIEVDSYEPKPSDESTDGPALVEVDVCETFIGDIEARESSVSCKPSATMARPVSSAGGRDYAVRAASRPTWAKAPR